MQRGELPAVQGGRVQRALRGRTRGGLPQKGRHMAQRQGRERKAEPCLRCGTEPVRDARYCDTYVIFLRRKGQARPRGGRHGTPIAVPVRGRHIMRDYHLYGASYRRQRLGRAPQGARGRARTHRALRI